MRRTTLFLASLLLFLAAVPAPAVTITIVNKDAAGQGLNDPTPATPVGGNPGTTVGEQRLNVFKKAADIWSGILPGNVDIRVNASFSSSMTCTTSSAVLGGTSPNYVESDWWTDPRYSRGGAVEGIWYVVAEASQLAGDDLEPGNPYMTATFNARLGQPGCLANNYFYYGFDTNTPSSDINLLTVTIHEFAHGLGFISLADETTGKFCCDTQPLPDIFDAFTYDTTAKKSWNDMATDAERQASAINTGNLVWSGPSANAAGAAYLQSGAPSLMVSAPSAAAGTYAVGTATFGPPLTASGVSGQLLAATPSDPGGSSSTDGCSPFLSAAALAGKVVLINRGTCNFTVKVKNAQNAGAIAVVIQDYDPSTPPGGMSGTDSTITIPAVRVAAGDGAKLRANLPAQVTLGLNLSQRSGMNAAGQMLLFAPNPVQAGSSVSHWDTSCLPNLLMEPNINNDLPIGVDITPEVFRDIGWFGSSPIGPTYYYVASVAHSAGGTPAAPAFFTSDLFVANEGMAEATLTFKFLGHDGDGTSGAEQTATISAGKAVTYRDVLSSLFGLTGNNYGGIRVAANSASLKISSVTTTPTPDATGAFGQSVPAVMSAQLITPGSPGAIAGVREDATGRTNLVLVNATEQPLDVSIGLWGDNGAPLGTLTQHLLPLEMTQLGRVIQTITGARNTANATIMLSTATPGGAFTAFASLLDNLGTNDPATLFASTGFGGSGAASFLVSSVARAAGGTVAAPAMYTTDFFVANVGSSAANVTLQYLAFGTPDGSLGPTRTYSLNPQTAYTFRDVLGSVFGISTTTDKGAILVRSNSPALAIDSVTTTPAPSGPGRFGQSVPGVGSPSWIRTGTKAAIVGVREDGTGRTNLVLVNGPPDGAITPYTIFVNYALFADDGTQLGTTQQVALAPLGMTQINRVVTTGVGAPSGSAGTLVIWTPTTGGVFTGFASLVNNGTNDPATLLPQ